MPPSLYPRTRWDVIGRRVEQGWRFEILPSSYILDLPIGSRAHGDLTGACSGRLQAVRQRTCFRGFQANPVPPNRAVRPYQSGKHDGAVVDHERGALRVSEALIFRTVVHFSPTRRTPVELEGAAYGPAPETHRAHPRAVLAELASHLHLPLRIGQTDPSGASRENRGTCAPNAPPISRVPTAYLTTGRSRTWRTSPPRFVPPNLATPPRGTGDASRRASR